MPMNEIAALAVTEEPAGGSPAAYIRYRLDGASELRNSSVGASASADRAPTI